MNMTLMYLRKTVLKRRPEDYFMILLKLNEQLMFKSLGGRFVERGDQIYTRRCICDLPLCDKDMEYTKKCSMKQYKMEKYYDPVNFQRCMECWTHILEDASLHMKPKQVPKFLKKKEVPKFLQKR